MTKLDNIFVKVINDPALVKTYGYDPAKYPDIARGAKALNQQVKLIAEILMEIDREAESQRSSMRMHNEKVESAKLTKEFKNALYKRVINTLLKG